MKRIWVNGCPIKWKMTLVEQLTILNKDSRIVKVNNRGRLVNTQVREGVKKWRRW